MSDKLSVEAFGESFHGFLQNVAAHTPAQPSAFTARFERHFGGNARELPILSEGFEKAQEPDVQLALDAFLARPDCTHELVGIRSNSAFGAGLKDLLAEQRRGLVSAEAPPEPGPIEYSTFSLGRDKSMTFVAEGLYFVRLDGEPLVIHRHSGMRMFGENQAVLLEVMAHKRELAEQFMAAIRQHMRANSVYRGRVLSLNERSYGNAELEFHDVEHVAREQIVLPPGVLEQIDRHTLEFSRHRDKLRAARRHLRRGILLFGPPGTGKTLTATYIATNAPERTVFVINGRGFGQIVRTCQMARLLEPATVILEDVDLIAEERTNQAAGCSPLLFELLNQMDGIGGDADVLFVLTTNRSELLEPALAARPGRIDLAIEIPLPDADCRRRLFRHYGQGLGEELGDIDDLIERTDGVSAAFLCELLRRAALFAAPENEKITVRKQHVEDALRELLVEGSMLTQRLLGVQKPIGFRTR